MRSLPAGHGSRHLGLSPLPASAPQPAQRAGGAARPDVSIAAASAAAPFEVRPASVPLEVGYTLPSRTFAHLFTEGAVARVQQLL